MPDGLMDGFDSIDFGMRLEPERVGVPFDEADESIVLMNAMKLTFQPLKIERFDFGDLLQIHAALVEGCSAEANLPRSVESTERLKSGGRTFEVHYAPPRELERDCAADLEDAVENFRSAVDDKDRRGAVEGLVDVHQVLLNAHYLRDHNATAAAIFVRKLALSEGINLGLMNEEDIQALRMASIEAVPDVQEVIGEDRYETECSTDTLYQVYSKAIGKRWEEKPELSLEAKHIARESASHWYPEHELKDVVNVASQCIDDPGVRKVFLEKEILRTLMEESNNGLTLPPYKMNALLKSRSTWLLGTEGEEFKARTSSAAESEEQKTVRSARR